MNNPIGSPHFSGKTSSAQPKRVQPKLRLVYKVAQEHCANLRCNGTCEGANVDLRTGRHFRWRKPGPCFLTVNQRCPYFEECVLPMNKRREKDWPTFAQGEAFRKAAQIYDSVFPETAPPTSEIRKCPDCGKRSVEPRNRYCAPCRDRRRKATKAANQRSRRKRAVERRTVKENGSSPKATSRAAISDTRYPLSDPPFFYGQTVLRAEQKEKVQ
jgi:hypothetical protein